MTATLQVDRLIPNPWNKARMKRASKQAIKELAASIDKVGVLQPIVVRQLNGSTPQYQIVAGERRWAAAKVAKLKEVPIAERDLTDVEVVEILAIENGQREDTHPLEDAAHYAFLLEKGAYDVAAIAAKVGKSNSHVYQRLKLAELIEDARDGFEKGELTLGHATLIARLPAREQQTVLKWINASWRQWVPVDELKDHIEHEIYLDLKGAPFDVKADDLVKTAPCTQCPKRSGYAPDLFPELAKRDVCTDPVCFRAKTQAHVAKKIKQQEAKGVELVRISSDYSGGRSKKNVIPPHDWTEAKKSDAGAKPAIVVQGRGTGTIKYVKVKARPKQPQGTTSHPVGPATDTREYDIHQAIIKERAEEFAELVKAISQWIVLEDDIALFFAGNFEPIYLGWPDAGGRRSRERSTRWDEELEEVIIPSLPGTWSKGAGDWGRYQPQDGQAGRHFLAFQVWLARDTGDLDKELEREAKKRLKAEEKAAKSAATKKKASKRKVSA